MKTLNKHLVSIAWRSSMMLIVLAISFFFYTQFDTLLNPIIMIFTGIILGEVSKYFNARVQGKEIVEFKAKRTPRKKTTKKVVEKKSK